MHIFLCEDSIDGIFTGIYDAWASRYGHKNIKLYKQKQILYKPLATDKVTKWINF